MKKGKLIVIDGADGTGKATQTKLLHQHLKKQGIKTTVVDFPQYETFFGKLVARFLRGEFGGLNEVSPYLTALPYAFDRYYAKEKINQWIDKGYFVLANRYTASNIAHLASKFSSKKEQEEFEKWSLELEYKINKLPKEETVIYLDMPEKYAAGLVDKKKKRAYLRGKNKDINESSSIYQKKVRAAYRALAKKNNWIMILSAKNGRLRTIDDIHAEIVSQLIKRRILVS